MKRTDFHEYQEVGLDHVLDNEHAHVTNQLEEDYSFTPNSGCFFEMGLGKTIIVLTAIDILQMASMVNKVLVVGPLRVCQSVWSQEALKWEHTQHLTFSHVLGDQVQRGNALRKKADIYIINRENIPWLQAYYKTAWPFDMVVLDESSSFKDPTAKRSRSLKMVSGLINRVVLLTGTPVGNGLMNLWNQIYMLDKGERFYDTVTQFQMRYFHNPEYRWIPVKGAEEVIYEKLQGLVISMKNSEYLNLPERIDVTVPVYFGPDLKKKYIQFERENIMALGDVEITAFNSGALSTKLQQFANGAIYDSEKNTHIIHDHKMEALEEIIESAGGKPVLIFYSFQSDLHRIQQKFKAKTFDNDKDIVAWNKGEISIAVAHPASAGHGLNLQECANIIIWYGLTWSLEQKMQADARLWRQGQKQKVYIYNIVTVGTVDEDIIDSNIKNKNGQDALMDAVKARVKKYRNEDFSLTLRTLSL